MAGEATDGHRFLDQAFAQGAAGALVSRRPITRMSASPTASTRWRTSPAPAGADQATIIGVTGSVGKTSAKEALYAALDRGWRGRCTVRSRATTTIPACR
jgi:UDP-N-acetylmuramoyl-tripeptide--D-alanyl-D-alanine ligase